MKDIEERKILSRKLVAAREDCKMTQAMVAETGVLVQSELSKIENAERSVSFITVCKLAKLYNKPLTYFEI